MRLDLAANGADSSANRWRRRWFRRLAFAAVVLGVAPGCTRKFFRNRADDDVTGVITQKNVFPDWKVENWHVYPDPRARFADLSNPDRPTFPPDDYAAFRLSPNPQNPTKKVGVGRVDGDGYMKFLSTWDVENRALAAAQGEDGAAPGVVPLPVPKPSSPDEIVPQVQPEPIRAPKAITKLPAQKLRSPRVEMVRSELEPASGVIPASATQPPVALPEPAKLPEPPVKPPETPAKPALLPGAEPAPVDVAATPEDYLKALETNQQGYRMTLSQSIELGVFNSREFQDQREALYATALPVTLERYQFAAQAFFAETIVRQSLGPAVPGGPLETWQIGTDASISKLFPTGGSLLVRIANQFVIDLTNGKPYVSVSNLSLTLAQPFLRGGGFAVTLEPLTQAERTLLYAIRSYARYRKLFYVAIAAGGGYTNNPYGLAGLGTNLGRGIGNNLTAPSTGFLPSILRAAVIANQQRNILSLQQLLRLYQAFREGGQQSDLQVGQVEQQLISQQSNLLGPNTASTAGGGTAAGGTSSGGIRGFLDSLDSFKLQLGLPMTVGIDLDDAPLRPIRQQLSRFEAVYSDLQEAENSARRYDPADPVAQFRQRWRTLLTESKLARGTRFSTDIRTRWAIWEKLSDEQLTARVAGLLDERRRLLDRKTERDVTGKPEPEGEATRLQNLSADIDLARFEQALRVYEAQGWLKEQGALRSAMQAAAFRDVFNNFYQLVLEARNDRLARIREQWPKLPPLTVNDADLLAMPLEEAYTTGIQTALVQRLDLMNTRGQVVDSWRQIKVAANALQGVLNVQYDLNSITPDLGGNPFAFSTQRSQQSLTINAELPLVRRAERNAYRAALIGYQAQRRRLMAFEDNIANDVRADIRELRVIAEQYRLQQRLIELGYSQVDNAQAILIAPPAPGAQNDAGSAAALTQQVLQAQSNLLTAQNNLYTIWVNYLVSRMQFYLDVEGMNLDSRGLWLDEFSPTENPDSRPVAPARERLPAPKQ